MTSTLYIGMMSGTSMDGVDGVLADFGNGAIHTLASSFIPFPPALRADLMALQSSGADEIAREALAANALASCYRDCAAALLTDAPGPVAALCAHGQTIRHRPELGYTRQTFNPALLAELAGIDVIADFRGRDVAAGGQGAPLVPAFHQACFGAAGQTRVVVNIGGIGNISVLHGDGRVSGFDTGPGNVLMDLWAQRHLGKEYDADGAWAATGKTDAALLAALMTEPYLAITGPKSTGRDLFHAEWLAVHLAGVGALAPHDVQATLTTFTAVTIAHAILREAAEVGTVYVCGGGAYNSELLRALGLALNARGESGQIEVKTTAALGVAPNRVEALAFAWLGQRFHLRAPGNLPSVTGAAGPRILGALYPA